MTYLRLRVALMCSRRPPAKIGRLLDAHANVVASIDNLANDGQAGENDNIHTDVERLVRRHRQRHLTQRRRHDPHGRAGQRLLIAWRQRYGRLQRPQRQPL